MNKLLERLDEKNYLTEREHRELLAILQSKLDKLAVYEKYVHAFEHSDFNNEFYLRLNTTDTLQRLTEDEFKKLIES